MCDSLSSTSLIEGNEFKTTRANARARSIKRSNGETGRTSPFLFLKEKLFELYGIFTVAFIKYKKY